MIVRFDSAQNVFFAHGVVLDDVTALTQLMWQPHPAQPQLWWTRSPYLAAPYWRLVEREDSVTQDALRWAAWNYWTSFSDAPIAGTGVDTIRIPQGEQPYPFQVVAVQRAMLRKRMLIADEPGLGKSAEALIVANMTRPQRIVIGCPAGLAHNWANECNKWLVDPQSITILDSARRNVPERGVLILPYSRGHAFAAKILAGPPIDHLIMDESGHVKNPQARRTAPWIGENGMAWKASRVIALDGTPIPNNPLEIHGLLACLSPETMGQVSREKFQQLYCSTFKGAAKVPTRGGGEATVTFEKNDGKNEHALNAELRASGVMVRRLKDDVLKQLPPKHMFLVHLSPTSDIERLVQEEATLYSMLQTKLMTSQELFALKGHIARVRHQLGVLKAPKIAEYVHYIFETGENRIVLFMLHREPIEIVRRAFQYTQIRVRLLTGSESPKVRQREVEAFQRDGGYELAIGQTTAAGVGLTMTKARYAVLGEIAWTPAVNDQCIDRVHRITQTRHVEAPVLTFPHAVEENVIRTNARKAISAHSVLNVNLQNMFTEPA